MLSNRNKIVESRILRSKQPTSSNNKSQTKKMPVKLPISSNNNNNQNTMGILIKPPIKGKKRPASPARYEIPKWSDWEEANEKLHSIFGYGGYDGTITAEYSQKLKSVLLDKFSVDSRNVVYFLDDLLEAVKKSQQEDFNSRELYQNWIEKIDNVRDQC
jgi:hypothetical protein